MTDSQKWAEFAGLSADDMREVLRLRECADTGHPPCYEVRTVSEALGCFYCRCGKITWLPDDGTPVVSTLPAVGYEYGLERVWDDGTTYVSPVGSEQAARLLLRNYGGQSWHPRPTRVMRRVVGEWQPLEDDE